MDRKCLNDYLIMHKITFNDNFNNLIIYCILFLLKKADSGWLRQFVGSLQNGLRLPFALLRGDRRHDSNERIAEGGTSVLDNNVDPFHLKSASHNWLGHHRHNQGLKEGETKNEGLAVTGNKWNHSKAFITPKTHDSAISSESDGMFGDESYGGTHPLNAKERGIELVLGEKSDRLAAFMKTLHNPRGRSHSLYHCAGNVDQSLSLLRSPPFLGLITVSRIVRSVCYIPRSRNTLDPRHPICAT
ncbi:unnamed protein product [Protopolystoma xenopodis]|uniref:Uncharacterized protein n=1 Tax=Protopolystoma xenopodis TaxID=117903 RepID=A0A3S5CVD7_9PLAT|nr:unnamed protein product [Protopolystoma xenopodis]